MDLRDGRYISPSTPATQVFFDKATPTTGGVVFDPNTPAASDTLYVSSTNSSTWIYQDGDYITYTAPVVNNTEWYITGTTIDAGSNKTASIERTGAVVIRNTTATSDFNMYSGSKRLQFKSDSATVNQIVSYSSELQINSFSSNLVLKTNNLERLKIASTGAVTLNAAYALPTVAPTSGQVLGYLGAGISDWVANTTFLNARVQTVTSSATVTPVSTNDLVIITAQAAGLTLANPTGTFTEGQALMIRIKDNGTARTIAFDTNYRAIGVTLPTTTVISKTLYLGIIYNATDGKWDIVGYNLQA